MKGSRQIVPSEGFPKCALKVLPVGSNKSCNGSRCVALSECKRRLQGFLLHRCLASSLSIQTASFGKHKENRRSCGLGETGSISGSLACIDTSWANRWYMGFGSYQLAHTRPCLAYGLPSKRCQEAEAEPAEAEAAEAEAAEAEAAEAAEATEAADDEPRPGRFVLDGVHSFFDLVRNCIIGPLGTFVSIIFFCPSWFQPQWVFARGGQVRDESTSIGHKQEFVCCFFPLWSST